MMKALASVAVDCARLNVVEPPDSARYLGLTYPNYRSWLLGSPTPGVLLVGAELEGRPVGLALAESDSGGIAKLISLAVKPAFRGRGLGMALLESLESELARRGATEIEANYRSDSASAAPLEAIFHRRGWTDPWVRMYLISAEADGIAQIPWSSFSQLPAGMEIFPWNELRGDERAQILARRDEDGWYPSLTPFIDESLMEPATSIGLRREGRVVGWQVNHRISPDVHRFTATWINRDLSQSGRALSLMAESIRRYLKTGIPRAVMAIESENQKMLRFFHRRIGAFMTGVAESRWVSRSLPQNSIT